MQRQADGTLQAGFYRRIVTPPINAPVIGGFDALVAEDILDDFSVSAVVLDDGSMELAVVSVDVIGMSKKICEDTARKVEGFCGIPAERVLLHAVHNHTGVRLADDGADHYTEFLKDSIVTAVALARKRKQPVSVRAGRAENRKHVFNRRLKKPDGSVIMNWTDRDCLQDCTGDGVADPEMVAVRFDRADGSPAGFLINYANHNNCTLRPARSADIFGHMAELIRRVYGQDAVTVCLLGACGNTNWIDFRDETQRHHPELHKRIGAGLAGTALSILANAEPLASAKLSFIRTVLPISERSYCDYDDKADNTFGVIREGSKDGYASAFRFFKESRAAGEGKPLETYELPLAALGIGRELAISMNPVELFSDFGLEIKSGSPFRYTMVAELTGGSFGYVPTLYAYEEGGYEVRKPASRMERDAGNRIEAASIELLNRL